MNKEKKTSIETDVMSKIKTGQVKMKPRVYFTILGVIGVLGTVLFTVAATYFMSIVLLWVRLMAVDGRAFGLKRNLYSMISDFPWWALLIGVLLLVISVYLLRRIGRLYKIKMVYLLLAVLGVALLIGTILSCSNLPGMFNRQGANMHQIFRINQ